MIAIAIIILGIGAMIALATAIVAMYHGDALIDTLIYWIAALAFLTALTYLTVQSCELV